MSTCTKNIVWWQTDDYNRSNAHPNWPKYHNKVDTIIVQLEYENFIKLEDLPIIFDWNLISVNQLLD